ncbi:ArsC family transcriptional regulator [Anaerocolumna cellulosilytica]|uniref:ArsC family transcriptional regulator n=1 Tax=Anaerocolumna cellulosilytica TaxID=433286 RepID=A0A6S6R347_9FIRM|nr:arsenate reductase family protein [Anaerocolumna cellulosilytica]MBB5194302.1 arsenate reductase [Anaerocolumna cellulosilytica]BCJ94487.1 ArsC family transcriptional regulator [Anaerocolumna cellulosilytica]
MLFLWYPKCSTCQRAKKWMDDKGIICELRDIKTNPPRYEELKEWYEISQLPLKRFFNTSGLIYKELGLKDKLNSMTEEEQLKLLATDGMLVKRPILITEKGVVPSFKEKQWEALL